MTTTATVTATATDVLCLHRNSRELNSILKRFRRSQSDARQQFRPRELSRRQKVAERRKDLRQPLLVPVFLTPCEVRGHAVILTDEPVMGVTRDVSAEGVGVSFDRRIDAQHVVVEIDIFGQGPVMLLLELRWTAKKSAHAYNGGGLWRGLVTVPQ